ncbi:membrane protein insertase YidC [Pigmentibacter sp. JX0631]|uniref:membrane protein insertase YidC n=1 Tax=Pigmentibacter sp. JX0631 TaxID=2976982 RepID=UPI002468FE42|nr:membrane protein insertase YidC [Pigmentibacter sp. JX0631]WGL60102.1 membrane protein insertase YidC [Pigmentibacter sp. JX0631]
MKKESIGFMLGLFLLIGGYIAINQYYVQKQQQEIDAHQKNIQAAQAKNSDPNIAAQGTTIPSQSVIPTVPAETPKTSIENASAVLPVANPSDLIIKKSYATFEFTSVGGCLGSNILTGEKLAYNDSTPVSVIENYNICKAFGFRVGSFDLRKVPAGISKNSQGDLQIVQTVNGLEITRIFKFADVNYSGEMQVVVKNIAQNAQSTSVDFEIGATSDNKNNGGFLSSVMPQYHSAAVRLPDGTVKREMTQFEESAGQKLLLSESGSFFSWFTVDSLYWMNAVIPQNQSPIAFEVVRTGFNLSKAVGLPYDQTVYEAWVKQPVNLAPGQSVALNYKLYIGPKKETILKDFDQYHLSETIDYGFFKIIARPMYHIVFFIHGLVNNWGVAIILLTILINIVFLPLQIKGYLSGQKMQKIQPQMKALQEKYKEDKQALQRETMALMSKSGVNPLSGCLPLLPQIPVFFALDSCLRHTFDLRQSPFFFWIKDLTQHDPYFILPILMAVLMLGYQKMIPMPSMDPTQAKMMKILPLVFSIFMVFYPSGLALYVITNTIISMIRQAFLTHRYKNVHEK